MKIFELVLVMCLAASAAAQVWCPNPPGNLSISTSECCSAEKIGLGLFMRSYFELMQIDCMLDIFFDALMFDPEVLDFYQYISGPEFEKLSLYIQNAPEFTDFTEYMCFELHFDPYQYLNTMGSILNIPHMVHPEGCIFEFPLPWLGGSAGPTISTSSIEPHNRPARWPVTSENGIGGVVGLIDVLYYEIPHEVAYDLWMYHVETDPYICRAVEKMRSPEFRYLVRRIENLPEYLNFVAQMESYNVNWSSFVEQLKAFLWESDYCL